MNLLTRVATVALLGLAAAAPSYAVTDAQKDAAVEKWQNMTPEQKAAAKAKAKARYDAMTPEQQAAARQRFAEKHPEAAARLESRKAASAP